MKSTVSDRKDVVIYIANWTEYQVELYETKQLLTLNFRQKTAYLDVLFITMIVFAFKHKFNLPGLYGEAVSVINFETV
mgnify:CR=1 FL=1